MSGLHNKKEILPTCPDHLQHDFFNLFSSNDNLIGETCWEVAQQKQTKKLSSFQTGIMRLSPDYQEKKMKQEQG